MAEPVTAPGAQVSTAPAATAPGELWRTVLRVAWLSVGLGLVLEVLLLMLAAYSGTAGDSPKPFISDLAQKVSWSFIVCVGLALGTAASKARAGVMGVLGLISAPVAFSAARAIHKGVGQALGVTATAGGVSPFLLAAMKAVEYGVLGAALGGLTRRGKAAGAGLYLAAGAAIGLTFGSVIVFLLARAAAQPMGSVDLAARAINEVLFPIGCSLVLYGAESLGKRIS
jgi:hypothetical protein